MTFLSAIAIGLREIWGHKVRSLLTLFCILLGVTSVVVTHDMKSVEHIADRVAYLREGKVYFEGTVEEVRDSTDPVVRSFVEGRALNEE